MVPKGAKPALFLLRFLACTCRKTIRLHKLCSCVSAGFLGKIRGHRTWPLMLLFVFGFQLLVLVSCVFALRWTAEARKRAIEISRKSLWDLKRQNSGSKEREQRSEIIGPGYAACGKLLARCLTPTLGKEIIE